MQHTDKYNFNLIDADDAFSPDALNRNAQALETELARVDAALAAKAPQTALDAEAAARTAEDARLDAAKAEKTALSAETAAREAALAAEKTRVDTALAAKAPQTALDAETAALAALTGRVGALEAGRLRFKFGTYPGAGTFGPNNPNRLEFDFKPIALIVCHSSNYTYGGYPWLNPVKNGRSYLSTSGTTHYVSITWKDRAVEWSSSSASGSDQYQLNAKDISYTYLALGMEE